MSWRRRRNSQGFPSDLHARRYDVESRLRARPSGPRLRSALIEAKCRLLASLALITFW